MVINFFGRRGSGKTNTIKGQLKDCRPPVLIVDVLGNFDDSRFIQCSELSEAILETKAYISKRKNLIDKSIPYVINLKTADPTSAADYFSSVIWEINGGTLILDEVDSVSVKEGSCFDQYIRYGRNHAGDLITGCRRPAELSKNITAAANKFYCFGTHEIRDIDYFYSIFGDRAQQLMTMPRYHGLFMDYDKEITGTFCTNIQGQIFHLEEMRIHGK